MTLTQTLQDSLDRGIGLHKSGRMAEAERIYKSILQTSPDHPDALHLLGIIAHQTGNYSAAVDLFRKAISAKPDFPKALNNLGATFIELKQFDDAIASYQNAITLMPDFTDAYYNLGNAFRTLRRFGEAVDSYQKCLGLTPDDPDTMYNLAIALKDLGKLDEAAASFRKTLALKPNFAEAHNDLGIVLKNLGDTNEAVANFQKALALKPNFPKAYNNLGVALLGAGNLSEAASNFRSALSFNPNYFEAHGNLGNALKDMGDLDEAISCYNKALSIDPSMSSVHSNALLATQYQLGQTVKSLDQLHRKWDARHGQQFYSSWPQHLNSPDRHRKLRVGFVSHDLRRHPVGYFVSRFLASIPDSEIEILIYSSGREDDLTEQIKADIDHWRFIGGMSDASVSELIIDAAVDILIDLSGHSAGNKMGVFARKPAPIQISWAGYVGTTGLRAMDYLLSDSFSTPKEHEQFYIEKIVRMQNGWLCYSPPEYAPDVASLPLDRVGHVTFATFSNPAKINSAVVPVWAKILKAVKNSTLLIKYRGINTPPNMERLHALFQAEGVDKTRLILEGKSKHIELLARYGDVDIALDPFPYSGGLTTFEALWMGVPVVTVPGETFASRHSYSHLS